MLAESNGHRATTLDGAPARRTPRVRLYIREWRKYRGMTLQDLGDLIQKEKITVSRWERNIYRISVDQLQEIAEILDCSICDLIKRGPHDEAVEAII